MLLQVSWVRHRDIHLLTVGRYTYTSDQRFRAIHQPQTEDWMLQIKYPQHRDSGIYECQVSTTPHMSHYIHLTVVGKSLCTDRKGANHVVAKATGCSWVLNNTSIKLTNLQNNNDSDNCCNTNNNISHNNNNLFFLEWQNSLWSLVRFVGLHLLFTSYKQFLSWALSSRINFQVQPFYILWQSTVIRAPVSSFHLSRLSFQLYGEVADFFKHLCIFALWCSQLWLHLINKYTYIYICHI